MRATTGLDALTLLLYAANVGLFSWSLAFEALIWRRFGVGSLYMAGVHRNSRAWWRSIGLSNRSTRRRAEAWLEDHAHDPSHAGPRAIVKAALGRVGDARAEIAALEEATPDDRWLKQRLRLLVAMVSGGERQEFERLAQRVAELTDPEQRTIAEVDLVGLRLGTRVADAADWPRELRQEVERVNDLMRANGFDRWRFRRRGWNRGANVAGGLALLILLALVAAFALQSAAPPSAIHVARTTVDYRVSR